MLTRWLVFHVASGQAFFTGAACLIAGVCLSAYGRKRVVRTTRDLLVCLGGVLVAVSATPLPPWFYLLLLLFTLFWVAIEASRRWLPARVVLGVRVAVMIAWSAAVLVEMPYHRMPRIPALGRPVLGIIGDSVSAGMGRRDIVNWPKLLADQHGVVVRDHSQMGANVASALRQARAVSSEERLVLVEIGGNDFFGETTPRQFEAGLSKLLSAVCRPGRVVVMLELPLPPFFNEYGRTQRRLARRYKVILVPKRVMLGVLERDEATLDTIHLSQDGNRWMAEAVWKVMREAYHERKVDP